jgi:hypothetical protein
MPIDNTPPAQVKQPAGAQPKVDHQQEIEYFLEAIAHYNMLGKALQRDPMQEVGQKLSQIAEMAELAVTNEAADWFDAHTVKRNMKEIKSYSGDFLKLAGEADMINQRMQALYDDMGRILERYFEIPELEPVDVHGVNKDAAGEGGIVPLKEEEGEGDDESKPEELPDSTTQKPDPKVFKATEVPEVTPDKKEVDVLTLRAIKSVYDRFKRMGKADQAAKFAKLTPEQQKQIVWKLVR